MVGDVPERPPRREPCLAGRHAGGHVALGLAVEMEAQLLVHLVPRTRSQEERAQTGNRAGHLLSRIRPSAPANFSQRAFSAASWRRPDAVSVYIRARRLLSDVPHLAVTW